MGFFLVIVVFFEEASLVKSLRCSTPAPQDYNEIVLTMAKAGRYVHTLSHAKDLQPVTLVCQVDAASGMKSLTVRSPLQVRRIATPIPVIITFGQ